MEDLVIKGVTLEEQDIRAIYEHYRRESYREYLRGYSGDVSDTFGPDFIEEFTDEVLSYMDDGDTSESEAQSVMASKVSYYQIYQTDGELEFRDIPSDFSENSLRDYRLAYTGIRPRTQNLGFLPDSVSDTENELLCDIYAYHNWDERPFSDKIRSLSVSDIILIKDALGQFKAFYVNGVGFELLNCNISSLCSPLF